MIDDAERAWALGQAVAQAIQEGGTTRKQVGAIYNTGKYLYNKYGEEAITLGKAVGRGAASYAKTVGNFYGKQVPEYYRNWRKSRGEKNLEAARRQFNKSQPQPKPSRQKPNFDPAPGMFSRKSSYTGDSWKRTKRRFRRRRRRRGSLKWAWRVLCLLQDKNTNRLIESGTINFAHGAIAIYTSRLYTHTFSATGGGIGPPPISAQDFNGFLANYQTQYISAGITGSDGGQKVNPLFNMYNPLDNPEVKFLMKAKCMHTFRNNNNGPLHLLVYVWRANIDIAANANPIVDSSSAFVPDLIWADYLNSSKTTNSNLSTTTAIRNAMVSYLSDAKNAIKPYWTKCSVEHIKLNPGEVYQKLIRHKKRIINLYVLQKKHNQMANVVVSTDVATNYGCYMFKGEYLLQVYVHGDIVHDAANANLVNYQGVSANTYGLDWTRRFELVGNALPQLGKKFYNYTNNMGTITTANMIVDAESALSHT